MDEALKQAIRAVGGLRAFARALGIAHTSVLAWAQVPPLRVLSVEKISGIPREKLRPDVYPPNEKRRR